VRHALRSLAKNGNAGALKVLGAGAKPEVRVTAVRLAPRTVKLGGELRFSFEIASTAKTEQRLLIDFAVHFVKANGETRPKVFKLRKVDLPAFVRTRLGGSVSFRDMTTRRHYPGRHRVDLIINGLNYALAEFAVRR
jgi:hypothetical protein